MKLRLHYFLCLILLLPIRMFSQQQDYTQYHIIIAKAEEELVNEHFNDALVLYKDCFTKYKFIFAKDAYHACQIAAYLNQKKDFDSLFILSIKQGVTYDLLKKTKLINKQIQSDSLLYLGYYKKYRNIYFSKIDLKLRKEFFDRFKEEQQAKNIGKINVYREVVNRNYKRIEELTKKGNFPGERLIGLDYGNYDPNFKSLDHDLDISNDYVYATLLHYPNAYSNLKPYLMDAIKYGITTPSYVIYLYSFEQTRNGILYNKNTVHDSLKYLKCYNYPFGTKSKNLDSVNFYRQQIGLCRYETEEKKINFSIKYGFIFKGM
jgi:hypothetical protein